MLQYFHILCIELYKQTVSVSTVEFTNVVYLPLLLLVLTDACCLYRR